MMWVLEERGGGSRCLSICYHVCCLPTIVTPLLLMLTQAKHTRVQETAKYGILYSMLVCSLCLHVPMSDMGELSVIGQHHCSIVRILFIIST